jgi:Putative metallopeptidase
MSTRSAQRPWHTVVLAFGLVAAVLAAAACKQAPDLAVPGAVLGTAQQPPVGGAAPAVKVVYQDDAIQPENRDVVRLIRQSGAFERLVDWTNQVVALPYPLEIRVTDTLPPGVDVPTTDLDGRMIYYPPFWLAMTREVMTDYVADILREARRPSAIPAERFNADDLTIWGNTFVLGHELGHALIHQLALPVVGLGEDAADGYALFSTLNGPDGTGPSLGAATLFDEMALRLGALTFEDYSSDHPIVQQRTYNFICKIVGNDPQRLQHSLVVEGYLPPTRAIMCPMEWAQLSYGWWTVLEPHFNAGFRAQGAQARTRAREQLAVEERALQELLRQPHGQP